MCVTRHAIAVPLAGKPHGALRQPTEREIEEWIRSRATTSRELREQLAKVNESYEIVFIPGILGSELKIGSFTYGKDPIEAHNLVFAPAQSVRAATLNEFKAQIARVFQKNVDIYGQGLNETQSANGGRPLIEFAYDWRDDLDKLAADFERFLQAQLPKKKFVVVAHSMGGVIAWHWKNRFNKPRKRELVALVTLGSPLQGSCEAARMLVEGYGPPHQSNSFEKWATHLVFGKAHAAVLTFPSVFALLPAYDERQPCLKIRRGTKTIPLDHHEVGSWLGRNGGDYQLPTEFAVRARVDARAYTERVTAAIKAGRAFRQAFDSEPYDDQIYLLYADNHSLSSNTVVEPRGRQWLARVDSGQEPGDGRVSRDSAVNLGNFDARRGAAVSLERDHGGLLADPRFSSFLRDNIKRLITQAKNAEILAFAQTQSSLRNELISRGWLADASLKLTSLDRIPAISSAMKTHADYNYDLLTSNKADPLFSGIDFNRSDRASVMVAAGDKISQAGDGDTATMLHLAAIATDLNSVPPKTLKEVGDNRLKIGQVSEAAALFASTIEADKRRGAGASDQQLLGETYHKLGIALERAGSVQPAIKSYQAAIQHGNIEASKRIETLVERESVRAVRPPEQSSDRILTPIPEQSGSILPPSRESKSPPPPELLQPEKPMSPRESFGPRKTIPNDITPQAPLDPERTRPDRLPPPQSLGPQGPTLDRWSPRESFGPRKTLPNGITPQAPLGPERTIPDRLPPPQSLGPQGPTPDRLSPRESFGPRKTLPNGATPQAPLGPERMIPKRLSPGQSLVPQEAVPNRLTPQELFRSQGALPYRPQQ